MSAPNRKSNPSNTPDDGKQPSVLDGLQFAFLLTWCFGTWYLFFHGEAANFAQFLFRAGLFATGLIGSLVVLLLRVIVKSDED